MDDQNTAPSLSKPQTIGLIGAQNLVNFAGRQRRTVFVRPICSFNYSHRKVIGPPQTEEREEVHIWWQRRCSRRLKRSPPQILKPLLDEELLIQRSQNLPPVKPLPRALIKEPSPSGGTSRVGCRRQTKDGRLPMILWPFTTLGSALVSPHLTSVHHHFGCCRRQGKRIFLFFSSEGWRSVLERGGLVMGRVVDLNVGLISFHFN